MERHILPSQILVFETLYAFAKFVDNVIQTHKSELSIYEEELGLMLRQVDQGTADTEWAKEVQNMLAQGKQAQKDDKTKGDSKKDAKKDEAKEKDVKEKEKKEKRKEEKIKRSAEWKTYRNIQIFTGLPNQGKTEIYFAAVNELRATLDKLKGVKETLSQLANVGINNSFYLVYTKNGIPEKLVLIPQQKQEQGKFEFKADFVTENVEIPIESREI
ncbi:MAG: hypothetical protein QXU32_00265 [Nitrososphaerales archaeon]